MIIGACIVELYLPGSASLKEKRSSLKSLIFRLRKEFNVATAEVGHHDVWQSAQIALISVSTDSGHLKALLERAVRWIEQHRPDLDVVDWSIELI